jgi:hypothetical protein
LQGSRHVFQKGFLFAGAPAWQKMPSLVEIEADLILGLI